MRVEVCPVCRGAGVIGQETECSGCEGSGLFEDYLESEWEQLGTTQDAVDLVRVKEHDLS